MIAKKKLCSGLLRFSVRFISTSISSPSGAPPPVRVGFTENAGRGAFATREIRTGDLIHTADPVVAHPSLAVMDKVCYLCLRRLKQEKCSYKSLASLPLENAKASTNALQNIQHKVHFCSVECKEQANVFYEIERKIDWSLYHERCRTKGLKYPLLVKRLACMVISGATSADSLDVLQPANFSHCVPSMIQMWIENTKARLKALRNIEAGEELRICYIDASMDCEARQSSLYHNFGFWCQCLRCMSGD